MKELVACRCGARTGYYVLLPRQPPAPGQCQQAHPRTWEWRYGPTGHGHVQSAARRRNGGGGGAPGRRTPLAAVHGTGLIGFINNITIAITQ